MKKYMPVFLNLPVFPSKIFNTNPLERCEVLNKYLTDLVELIEQFPEKTLVARKLMLVFSGAVIERNMASKDALRRKELAAPLLSRRLSYV